jgi:4-hydroxy-tetrahydrodipicolinate synthase
MVYYKPYSLAIHREKGMKGSIVALVTPMFQEGAIDEEAFVSLLEFHLQSGTAGVVILGSTGEGSNLREKERKRLITLAVSRLHNKLPLIVGTGSLSTARTIEATEQAFALGADAALIVTPYYNRPTQEGLKCHFSAIADAVSFPQILYNVPKRTGCDLLPETVAFLAKHKNIFAIKEATGDLSRLSQMQALIADPHFSYYSGDDPTARDFIEQGGCGVISVVANAFPETMQDLCEAALQGDKLKAEALNTVLAPWYQALSVETNPIPIKGLLAAMGKIAPGIRLPLTPLSAIFQKEMETQLKKEQGEYQ